MKKFVELFKEVMEIENVDVNGKTIFRELEDWDSLAVLSVLAMINDEYDITIAREKFEKANTLEELFALISE